jgi:hypothetical protein
LLSLSTTLGFQKRQTAATGCKSFVSHSLSSLFLWDSCTQEVFEIAGITFVNASQFRTADKTIQSSKPHVKFMGNEAA